MAAETRLSGNLDRVIEIARPSVADPEGDNIVYSVKRGPDLVERWRVFPHEAEGNTIRLRLDLGLNAEFTAAEGVFPAGTDVFFETEDGKEQRYTITRFLSGEDAFDYSPEISVDGQTATFLYSEDLAFVPGINQAAAGAAFVVAELDRPLVPPGPNVRTVEVSVGYGSTPAKDLFAEDTRKAWARLEEQRITPEGRETEWTIADPEIATGDLILYGGQRLAVREVEGIERSHVRQVTAVLEADGAA